MADINSVVLQQLPDSVPTKLIRERLSASEPLALRSLAPQGVVLQILIVSLVLMLSRMQPLLHTIINMSL